MGISPGIMQKASPVGIHAPGNRVNLWRIGKKAERFQMFAPSRLKTGDGVDCGPFYRVKWLPVSERVNGGEGVTYKADGSIQCEPSFWRRVGWTDIARIPDDWNQVNAKAWAKKKELDSERSDTPQAKALRETIASQASSSAQIATAVQALVAQGMSAKAKNEGKTK